MTVDVEDYFQVEAFSKKILHEDWDRFPCRVEQNVDRILSLFADTGTKATFFTLGWIADRYPHVVERIVQGGHELASHGYAHVRADHQSRGDFQRDIRKAKAVLEELSGMPVTGYRAPCFSIGPNNAWAFDELIEAGYRYSSSLHPIMHDNYGFEKAPRFAFHPLHDQEFIEIPVTTLRAAYRNWPCGGGGYFRLLPYGVTAAALRHVSMREGRSCIFYFHPWELDPSQPRIGGISLRSRVRHYLNLDRTARRLGQLLKDMVWDRVDLTFLGAGVTPGPIGEPGA